MKTKLGNRELRALAPESEIWDTAVSGFGARRQRSETISYIVMYRTAEGRQRRHTIGKHGAPWTPDTARNEARRVLGRVASGEDPAAQKAEVRRAITVADLCDAYLADAAAGRQLTKGGAVKKASTLDVDRLRIDRHIKPVLGRLTIKAVTQDDVERFMHTVAEGGRSRSRRR